jgi:hypothetical protein
VNPSRRGKQSGERREQQFASVLHLGQGRDAPGTQSAAADEVRGG